MIFEIAAKVFEFIILKSFSCIKISKSFFPWFTLLSLSKKLSQDYSFAHSDLIRLKLKVRSNWWDGNSRCLCSWYFDGQMYVRIVWFLRVRESITDIRFWSRKIHSNPSSQGFSRDIDSQAEIECDTEKKNYLAKTIIGPSHIRACKTK